MILLQWKQLQSTIPEDALGEIIGPTHATDEQLNQMRSMYVKDENGVLHHKRTLLKLINNGKGLKKNVMTVISVQEEMHDTVMEQDKSPIVV